MLEVNSYSLKNSQAEYFCGPQLAVSHQYVTSDLL